MHFDCDAFISYAHLDNVELVEGRKGWVANLHRALEVRVAQLLGKAPHIWRDPKLSGNDLFENSIVERLKQVAILVAVVSPRYLKSEWTLREFNEFCNAAEHQGGIRVRDKARVFKILKTPVPLDRMPPALKGLLGYEFFRVDPETGKVRELDEIFGPDAHRDFWLRLDDLAHDVCALLESLEESAAASAQPAALLNVAATPVRPEDAVYLAETTSDLREAREALRRDLLEAGYRVLPEGTLPLVAEEAETEIRRALEHVRLSIHPIGRQYGLVPEGGSRSLVDIQHELAAERDGSSRFARLIWIPERLEVQDHRQRQILERLRADPRLGHGADLVETYFEGLRTVVQDWIRKDRVPVEPPPAPAAATPTPVATDAAGTETTDASAKLYVMADERDLARLEPWADALFRRGFEVILPVFQGEEREIREYHEENLAHCDAVLIAYGAGNEVWVRRKLREIQKAAGYGRSKPAPPVAVCLIGPHTPEKDRFRTHEATIVPQWDGVALDAFGPFFQSVKAVGAV